MDIDRRRFLRTKAVPIGLAAAAVLVIVWQAPISNAVQSESESSTPIAVVNGEEILESELVTEASKQLERVALERLQCEMKADQKRHEVLSSSAERVVQKRLLALEAERLDSTSEALLAALVKSVQEPTAEDIDAWWEKNSSRVRQPREKIEDQIKELLARQGKQAVETEFYSELEERYAVEVMLDPYRLEVASAGFPSLGPEGAPVTIVEFSDFECPYCARVLPTLEQVQEKFPDTVKLVFRQFPLDMHRNARKAAEASLCANDQGKFWEMHDLMFDEQKQLTVTELKDKAGRLELDQVAFDGCLDSGRHSTLVDQDLRAGQVVGVTGTPAMFVNGRMLSGAVDFPTVEKVINDEIERANRG